MKELPKITKQRCIIFCLGLFIILLGLTYSVNFNFLDSDFGWHLKTGQLILERGVPKIDWYSYTMPDFSWIDHEWLTDIFIYKIYCLFNYQFLVVVFLTIFILAFIVLIKKEYFFYFLPPIFLGLLASFGFLGIRPQIITVLFVAILSLILDKFFKKTSWRILYLLPILFFVWANLHGGFIIGLFLIFFYLVLEIFKTTKLFKKIIALKIFSGQYFLEASCKKIKHLSIIFIFCLASTLANPYGIRIYDEIYRTAINPLMKSNIIEWLPIFYASDLLHSIFKIIYIGLFIGLLIIFYKKINFDKIILSLIFLCFAISSQRNLLIFIILTLPVFAELFLHLRNKIVTNEITPPKIKLIFKGFRKYIIILFICGLFILGFYPYFTDNIKAKKYNSRQEKVMDFLKKVPLSENLLHEYNWGGYLIWKLPARKVFIDGRMPVWYKKDNFIFSDYLKLMKAKSETEELLKKYNIKIVLLNKSRKKQAEKFTNYQLKPKNKFKIFVEKQKWTCRFFGLCLPTKNIYNQLIDWGWYVAYEDDLVVILRSNL